MTERSIVLLSGGLDSAVALFWALDQGHQVEALSFHYFRRSKKEIDACKKIANFARVENRTLNLDFLREVQDLRQSLKDRNPLLKRAQSAYIPSRNIIFYGIASSFAEILRAKYIIGGHNKNDKASFPDSSKIFFEQFNKTAKIGQVSKHEAAEVILPLADLDKSEVVKLGAKLGVPFDLTWSCYYQSKHPCKKCLSCKLRTRAFAEAGVEDPLTMARA